LSNHTPAIPPCAICQLQRVGHEKIKRGLNVAAERKKESSEQVRHRGRRANGQQQAEVGQRSVGWMAGLIDVALSGLSRRRLVKLMESRGGGVCQNESHE